MTIDKKIKVLIAGAAGRMGRESAGTVLDSDNMELVGVVGRTGSSLLGKDIGTIIGRDAVGITLSDNLKDTLQRTQPDVMLDFTIPSAVFSNACIALECGSRVILGATGLSDEDITELEKKSKYYTSSVLIAPNFAIGALMMIATAKKVAKYMHDVEIIEYHHNQKVDAPSGTATKTAKELSQVIKKLPNELSLNEKPRGEVVDNIRVHSIRLPGMLAHQEIIFGDQGQTLTLRHDTINRSAFMPGVVLAINEIMNKQGLIYGLENLLDI